MITRKAKIVFVDVERVIFMFVKDECKNSYLCKCNSKKNKKYFSFYNKNLTDEHIGNKIKLSIKKNFLYLSFFLYIFPLLTTIICSILTEIFYKNELISISVTLITFVISIFIIKKIFKKILFSIT